MARSAASTGDRARLTGERCRHEVSMAEHRLAFGEMRDCPGRRFSRSITGRREQVRRQAAALRLPRVGPHCRGRKPEFRRLALPIQTFEKLGI